MSACEIVSVPVHCTSSLSEKIESVHDRITRRAYERWLSRRVQGQTIVECWSVAERELLRKPEADVREGAHGITVDIACADVEPSKIRLFMSATELLVLAPLNLRGLDQWLFRYLRFQRPLAAAEATAQFTNGKLSITAAAVDAPEEEKFRFRVA